MTIKLLKTNEQNPHITNEDTFEKDWKDKEGKNMKFDVVVGNPPFQPDTTYSREGGRKGTGLKIWQDFIEKALDVSKDNAIISFITPAHWRIGNFTSSEVKNLQEKIWKYKLLDIGDANKYFNVGTHLKLDWWVIDKGQKVSNKYPYLTKYKYFPRDYDPVLMEKFMEAKDTEECYELDREISDNRSNRYDCIRKLKEGDKDHPYPYLVSIPQYRGGLFDWYAKKLPGFDDIKVMVPSSVNLNTPGNFISLFNSGGLGCGHACHAFKMKSEKEGKDLENFINNSKIIRGFYDEFNGPTGYAVPLGPIRKIPKSWVERFNKGEDL